MRAAAMQIHQPADHRPAPRHQARARILGDVVGSHHEAGKPRLEIPGAGRDRLHIENRKRRLDHRPDTCLLIGSQVEQPLADLLKLTGQRNFRHHDAVRRGLRRRRQIVGKPRRVEAVDADEHLAGAEAASLHRRRDLRARIRLGVGRHRVLQIEDHAVGRQCARLLDGAGIRARHVEHAAAGADGDGHAIPLGANPSDQAEAVPA